MVTLMISHEVKNYDEFKKAFDQHEEIRAKAGVKILNIFNGVENKNHVTVISEVGTIEDAKAFMANPNLKEVMEAAGVISAPEVKMLNKVQ